MSSNWQKICLFCFFTGTVLPWGLLVIAGGFGLTSGYEWADRMSAYAAAFGLLVMALGFFFARFMHWISR